ncbi:MAG: hypothetical protein H7326_11870, partial [Bdellovibrionaceae bacterium]|nr:hypothetical protein [Pseudobdellovibrionaceae bacterium]
ETRTEGADWTRLASQGSTDLAPQTELRIQLWGHFDRTEKVEKTEKA